MRMVSDRTGVNISVSEATKEKGVAIFLRNVTAEAAVEEICRQAGLWFRRERASGIIRIMTMGEYSESLNTFREESTEMFTLLYPNVIEVASVIYGLYPDRTFLSLGEEEFYEDDENDLARRFRRFRVLDDNGGSQFMSIDPPRASSSGATSSGGNFSYTRGSAASRLYQWDQVRERARRTGAAGETMSADDAAMIGDAQTMGDTNLVDLVRSQSVSRAANIFVTISRKNKRR